MILSLISIALLLALGLLNAQQFMIQKHDKIKDVTDALLPHESYIGLGGLVIGVAGVLGSLNLLRYDVVYAFLGVASSCVILVLGFLSSLVFLKTNVFQGNQALLAKLDGFAAKVMPHQTLIGLSAIFLAFVYFFLLITVL